jgi:uncharacterized protein (DUF58 family)
MIVQEDLPAGLATDALDPVADERRRIVLPPRSGRAQLMGILETLARVQIATGALFVRLLREESVHLAWGSTLVAVTGRVDDDLAETLLYLKRSGHAVALVVVEVEWGHGERGTAGGRGAMAGIPVYRVRTERDLAVWR